MSKEADAEAVKGAKPFTHRERFPYYPTELKHHYIDLLQRIKVELSRSSGKPIGWQTIRDMIMEPEDAAIASAEQEKIIQRGATKTARSPKDRDTFLTIEHLKAWNKRAALPSDPRCYFIERFINRLRKDGKLEHVEYAATVAKQRYLKDALYSLYRPDTKLSIVGSTGWLLEDKEFSELSNSGFLVDGALLGSMSSKIDLILIFGQVDRLIFDVEILLVRRKNKHPKSAVANSLSVDSVQPDNVILLFHGFFVPHRYFAINTGTGGKGTENVIACGTLLVRSSSQATAADLGFVGNLPASMQCNAEVVIDRGYINLEFFAGEGLAAFASLFPTTPKSVLEPTYAQPRVTTRLSDDLVVAVANRMFARPCFG